MCCSLGKDFVLYTALKYVSLFHVSTLHKVIEFIKKIIHKNVM